MANKAALYAFPIATVATGTPLGICAISTRLGSLVCGFMHSEVRLQN